MQTARQQTPRITLWKVVVIGVCLSVFLFGLQAKLAQYDGPSPGVTVVTSVKLWDGDHRMEVQNLLGLTELLALAIVLRVPLLVVQTSTPLPAYENPAPIPEFRLTHLRRFFRPPPAR